MVLKPNTEHDVTKTRAFFKGKHNATLLSRGASPDEIGAAVVFPWNLKLTVDGGMIVGRIYWQIGKAIGNL
ncbi:hypothetical protein [Pseudochrobactrum sp. B5]|uniref:hypothetical protein n=1 Tax=Pseudochrobactrum sp. B5 TaxID=1289478 RepID=UPI000AB0B115|nr:hypothetical protein [Pseudochrobactrum sp. B5]